MTVIKARELINNLLKKGFHKDDRDHKFLILYADGKKTSIFTKVSHGTSEVDDFLIGRIALQLKLEKKQFIELVECPLDEKDYLNKLKKNGYLVQ